MNYNKVAQILDDAARFAKATSQVSTDQAFNLEEAYALQSISMSRRYQRGEKLVGLKMGFTSKAKMEQMGVHDLIWGRLTDQMAYASGSDLNLDQFIHPRAEPEIAFLISKEIDKPLDLSNVKEYVDSVAVALEIIDSRYENFKFSLEDVVADNCSSAGFVVGEWKSKDMEINNLEMRLMDGETVLNEGNSHAILGNPWESLVAAVRLAHTNGEKLVKGSIVLAGAATAASYLKTGMNVTASAETLGSVTLNVK